MVDAATAAAVRDGSALGVGQYTPNVVSYVPGVRAGVSFGKLSVGVGTSPFFQQRVRGERRLPEDLRVFFANTGQVGVAVVPVPRPGRGDPSVIYIPLSDTRVKREIGMARVKGRELPPAARRFAEFVSATASTDAKNA